MPYLLQVYINQQLFFILPSRDKSSVKDKGKYSKSSYNLSFVSHLLDSIEELVPHTGKLTQSVNG